MRFSQPEIASRITMDFDETPWTLTPEEVDRGQYIKNTPKSRLIANAVSLNDRKALEAS